MRMTLPALLLLLQLPAGKAAAAPCKDLPQEGVCAAETRVEWCEDGMPRALDCTGAKICAWNSAAERFDCLGGSCQAHVDGKGTWEVPVSGMCDGEQRVVYWCDAGEVKTLQCGPGTGCGYNALISQFDCLALDSPGIAEPRGSQPRSAEDAGPIPPDASAASTGGPGQVPRIQWQDTRDNSSPPEIVGGGCSQASRPTLMAPSLALLTLALLGWRRKRRRGR